MADSIILDEATFLALHAKYPVEELFSAITNTGKIRGQIEKWKRQEESVRKEYEGILGEIRLEMQKIQSTCKHECIVRDGIRHCKICEMPLSSDRHPLTKFDIPIGS